MPPRAASRSARDPCGPVQLVKPQRDASGNRVNAWPDAVDGWLRRGGKKTKGAAVSF